MRALSRGHPTRSGSNPNPLKIKKINASYILIALIVLTVLLYASLAHLVMSNVNDQYELETGGIDDDTTSQHHSEHKRQHSLESLVIEGLPPKRNKLTNSDSSSSGSGGSGGSDSVELKGDHHIGSIGHLRGVPDHQK